MRRIGHRGAPHRATENTLASFSQALELNVHGIEFDIQLSKDGQPVVIHDHTLDRTTNGKGAVANYDYTELKTLDVPHLDEVFELVDRRCDLLIELKVDAVEQVEELIRKWVSYGWRYEQLWVLSFHHDWLRTIKQRNAYIHTCASFEDSMQDAAVQARLIGANAIAPNFRLLTPELVEEAQTNELMVFTWTVNEPHDIACVKSMAVDGIISDYPERL